MLSTTMLKLKVKEMLQSRGVVYPQAWLRKNLRISYTKANQIVHARLKWVNMQDLDALCQKLDCTPNDLMYYVQDGRQTPLEPAHNLRKLHPPYMDSDLIRVLGKLPPKRVEEYVKMMVNEAKENPNLNPNPNPENETIKQTRL